MKTLYKANFICSFNELQRYPFNTQICEFKLFISGVDNMVTDLRMLEDIRDGGPPTVDQYVVLNWTMREGNVTGDFRGLIVSVELGSNLMSIFLVTYLPTIIINTINQATNYLDTELLITVNVTCMMVLFSVYLTVSNSLPSTPSIKPVEVWLLFNSAYPFMVIITNILIEVTHFLQ